MKLIRIVTVAAFIVLIINISVAQPATNTGRSRPHKWVAETGFWVIETSIDTPTSSVLRFYTDERQLIYTERVSGTVLNIRKRRTLMKLKRALVKAIRSWERNGVIELDGGLVSTGKQAIQQ